MHYCGEPCDGMLLLVHGAGNNCGVWEEFASYLGLPWVAVDLPGHGKSGGDGFESISDYARSVADFVESLKVKDVVLVGHSMGGAIVQAVMAENPSWLKAGVLVSTGPKLKVNPAIFEGLEREPEATIGKVARWAVAKGAPEDVVERTRAIFSSAPVEVVIKDFRACDAFDGEGLCSSVKVPVLVVVGSEDVMTPPKLSKRLVELIPEARLEVIEGAGHMLQLERPKELARVIVDFVKGL